MVDLSRLFKSLWINNIMSNVKRNGSVVVYGRTYRSDSGDDNDDGGDATTLTIPKEIAKELDIENCKISITVLHNFNGREHLLISKYDREIGLD
jgi:hypothetical protein